MLLYIALGAAGGFALGYRLRPASSARCCEQLGQLVRDDLRTRCGALGGVCEGLGSALGVFDNASQLLDVAGVTHR